MPMPLIPDPAVFQQRLAALPLASLSSRRDGARRRLDHRPATDPQGGRGRNRQGRRPDRQGDGARRRVRGTLHTAESAAYGRHSCAETSQFHVADAAALLAQDPIALLYVAAILASRLDGANHALIELKRQLEAGQPPSVIAKTVEKMEDLLAFSGASLAYAGYPYDPFAPGAPNA